jgi:hypothetical protein
MQPERLPSDTWYYLSVSVEFSDSQAKTEAMVEFELHHHNLVISAANVAMDELCATSATET